MEIDQKMKVIRTRRFNESNQWSLGQLIDALRDLAMSDTPCSVYFAFGSLFPTKCKSWRGAYDELAIGYSSYEQDDEPPFLDEFLAHLYNCVGETFTGYKGGEYIMTRDTPLWVANYGYSGNTGVIGIRVDRTPSGNPYAVTIRTDYIEF